ncbi:hypothetical protein [Tuwongella immobilis]|uniref:Carboxypeptidase regulatory-like domain-containing protein n=1 Tax=Tuwongella immobilis TaxID=692036 RepID=A0A6C2YU21_9BACT|nr:hypothetical protein [Tuwongella immobilis]VIP04891.1 Uncharacterized protein OS=Planctomyces brasiliensis (strain ATCC 49424 / DSM 5305 / JCM 21570 / NBRC 103401 / IFAM 1448) GN=Plabr_4601 PE=4 SV=1 [Tuwongella immobilis]VTS07141.1 Uncharacterized protein OS=Planctomyces brasiliensis (strain ATCC 49424 / DSM 5305 / JCM 21570 / NBRC 103401 / IFAM 1448) GN=Plabr_4601 PE=4 SV=1 [Tuwongella immobilis]
MPRSVRWCSAVLLALGVGFFAGCSQGDGPSLYEVSGTIEYNGKPVEKGAITFRNLGSDGRGYSGDIVDGKYSLKCEAGEMRVEILGSRTVPGKTVKDEDGKMVPVNEMYLPAKYNSSSTLKIKVEAKSQTIPFQLEK